MTMDILLYRKITLILTIAALLLYIAQLLTIPLRKKRISARAGNLVLPLANGSSAKVIGILFVCLLVILALPLRNFAPWISVVLLICALFGENFAIKELSGIGKAGIYENGIISGTGIVFFDEVFSFPTFSYENDADTVMVDRQTLQVMKKDNSKISIVFESKEKREEAVKTILELHPEFKE